MLKITLGLIILTPCLVTKYRLRSLLQRHGLFEIKGDLVLKVNESFKVYKFRK